MLIFDGLTAVGTVRSQAHGDIAVWRKQDIRGMENDIYIPTKFALHNRFGVPCHKESYESLLSFRLEHFHLQSLDVLK